MKNLALHLYLLSWFICLVFCILSFLMILYFPFLASLPKFRLYPHLSPPTQTTTTIIIIVLIIPSSLIITHGSGTYCHFSDLEPEAQRSRDPTLDHSGNELLTWAGKFMTILEFHLKCKSQAPFGNWKQWCVHICLPSGSLGLWLANICKTSRGLRAPVPQGITYCFVIQTPPERTWVMGTRPSRSCHPA